MKNKWSPVRLHRLAAYTLGVFLLLFLVVAAAAMAVRVQTDRIRQGEIAAGERNLVSVEKAVVGGKLDRLISDVLYIGDTVRLNRADNDKEPLKDQWIAFSNRKHIYDHIVLLNAEGKEVVRVNYGTAGAYAAGAEDLLDQSESTVFRAAVPLGQGQVWVSAMFLNIENGAVEEPIKPMICLATPYYGANGKLAGVIVLNYLARDMLTQVERVASTSHNELYLLNDDGYWVYNSSDRGREWAFMYPDRTDDSFAARFSPEWKQIAGGDKDGFVTGSGYFYAADVFKNNEFLATNSNYTLVLGGGNSYFIARVAPDSSDGRVFARGFGGRLLLVLRDNLPVWALLLALSLLCALLLDRQRGKKEQIRYFSQYDAMTGVYNRRMGMERLAEVSRALRRESRPLSLCFLDVNGLKLVNDTLGHESGDALLLCVVNTVRAHIRADDFLARLGGDEFLLVLPGLAETQAESVWQRICAAFAQVNDAGDRAYLVSVSHGIVTAPPDSSESMDALLERADARMYLEKRELKKTLQILR